MQSYLDRTLYQLGRPLGYDVWVEQRIRTQLDPRRYRIPDICLTLGEPEEDVFVDPPFLCIEILSSDDSALELRLKIDEYLRMGVAYLWVVDPISLTGEVYTDRRIERVRADINDSNFRAGDIEVNIRVLR